METPQQVRERWVYLRDLLIDQLSRFEGGILKIHAADIDVSLAAIAKLKKNIGEFDTLISRSEARERSDEALAAEPPAP